MQKLTRKDSKSVVRKDVLVRVRPGVPAFPIAPYIEGAVSMEVKALTFDVFGTVVDWRGGTARGFSVDGNAFALAWRARYQPAMERVRSG